MNATICRSLLPWRTISRISSRRSLASPALESAMVWFWHTRQRSSEESAMTRASSAGSAAAGAASFGQAAGAHASAASSTSSLATLELLHERQDLLLQDLARHGTDALVADDAALVDQVGLGHAVDAVDDSDAALEVERREPVRVAHVMQQGEAVLALVLVIQAQDRHGAGLGEVEEHRVLLAAAHAPRSPHVQEPDLAEHVALGEGLARLAELRQLEMRRRLADERRRHLARVERETDAEQRDQDREDAERKNEAVHERNLVGVRPSRPRWRRALRAPCARPAGSAGRSPRSGRRAPSAGTRSRSSRR